MAVQSSQSSILMDNIVATISDYSDIGNQSFSLVVPATKYLNENLPKDIGVHESESSNLFGLRHIRNFYDKFGDNIVFEVMPLGNINKYQEYSTFLSHSTTERQKWVDYPSMVINPLGNLISAPIYFDNIPQFINNGLKTDTVNQNSDYNDINNHSYNAPLLSDQNNNQQNTSSYAINWDIENSFLNGVYVKNANESYNQQKFFSSPQSSWGNMTITTKNFGVRAHHLFQKTGEKFSFVTNKLCTTNGIIYPRELTKDQKTYAKRTYVLPENIFNASCIIQNCNSIKNNRELYSGLTFEESTQQSSQLARPFYFQLSFGDNVDGNAQLCFGHNMIQFNKDGIYVSLCTHHWYNQNTLQVLSNSNVTKNKINIDVINKDYVKLPFLAKDNFHFNNSYNIIVYPAYCGLTIQPGIHTKTQNFANKKQKPMRAIGGVAQRNVINKRRKPSITTWFRDIKDSSGKTISNSKYHGQSEPNFSNMKNIFVQNNNILWDHSDDYYYPKENRVKDVEIHSKIQNGLMLRLNNCTASFFYMPLYFCSSMRFRMYFKGIKSGQYKHAGIDKKGKHVGTPVNGGVSIDQKASESIAVQYKHNSITDQYSVYAYHTYYANLMYTTQYGVEPNYSNDSKMNNNTMTFISNKYTAYNIPPPSMDQVDSSFWQTYNKDGYFFDFDINMLNSNQYFPFIRTPIQIFAVLIVQHVKYEGTQLKTSNGKFQITSKPDNIYQSSNWTDFENQSSSQLPCLIDASSESSNWSNFITNISTTWTEDGGSGSITLDKYAFMGQQFVQNQSIGGLQIVMKNGNPNIIKTSGSNNFKDCIFTGYGTKVASNDSFQSDTIQITLQGPQRKLQDLKLINAPFWDGDPLMEAYYYMEYYCGINILYDPRYFDQEKCKQLSANSAKYYVDDDGQQKERKVSEFPKLPTSSNFKRPAVYFNSGKDCFSALQQMATMCNCRFCLQPDGNAYVLTQGHYSVPLMCDMQYLNFDDQTGQLTSEYGYQAYGFDENLILNFSIQPQLNNLHNFIISASFFAANDGNEKDAVSGETGAYQTLKNFADLDTKPNIPWSKVKAFKHDGFLTTKQLQTQFFRDRIMVSSYFLNVKVTIPGNQCIRIYDIVRLFGVQYYVYEISHSIDLQSKRWTTDLTLNNVIITTEGFVPFKPIPPEEPNGGGD